MEEKKSNVEMAVEAFSKDVERHVMTVFKDDGLYRHLRFRRPDTWCMGFDIVTWPGFLAYTGDMGEFMFSRLEDMFVFFRGDGKNHGIDYRYWAEKCKAGSRDGGRDRDGVTEFSEREFQKAVERDFESWLESHDGDFSEEQLMEIKERLESEVMGCSEGDGPVRAYDAVMEFEVDGKQLFQDFWEHDCSDYTFRFVWCCQALRWGIGKYDEYKVSILATQMVVNDENS